MKKSIAQKAERNKGKSEQVIEEFTGKNLTRFGGVGLIRRFLERYQIEEQIEQRIRVDGRRESKYSIGEMIVSFLFGMFLGYARPTHMEILTRDKVFQRVAGLSSFPVQSTISRFLSSLKVAVSEQIASFNCDLLMRYRKRFEGMRTLTLDLDSHVTPVYGSQQRAAIGYNPKKKGRKSYHPLLCFLGETGDYLGGMLRSGNHHTSYQAVAFLTNILKKLPSHIENIRLRADSGFFSLDLLKYLVGKPIEFYIVVPMQPWIQRKIYRMRNWESIGWGIGVSECEYVFAREQTVRMVVIRQRVRKHARPRKQLKLLHTEDALYDYQVIVTNGGLDPEEVWRFYNKRACCENFIKEGIYGFGLDKVVSHQWAGNRTWFELLMLAYNLMNFFKEEVLGQKKVKHMISWIRERLFFIPAKLTSSSRKWVLKLDSSWFYKDEYEAALARFT